MMFYLKKIKLINYRCYSNCEYTFSPDRNIIVGLNAVGKTSLVEAIYSLCFGKSFKNVKDLDIIKLNETYFNIKAEFINDNDIDEVIVSCDSNNKRIKKNNHIYKSISDYMGYFNVVVFSPDDLELSKGPPNVRRKLIDTNLSQIDKEYLTDLIKYKKILKERNEYLKENTKTQKDVFLDVLTTALIEVSQEIILKRARFIDDLNNYVSKISKKINKTEEVKLVYKPSCNVDKLWKTAKEKLEIDKAMKTTTWGPSRDEMLILINDKLASVFNSQGQIRSACLAIKLSLSEMIKQKNKNIIVILDDVFSELDEIRQNQVMELIKNSNQTFITTTSIDNLSNKVIENSKIIDIKKGD